MKSKWWVILMVLIAMIVVIFFVKSKSTVSFISPGVTKTTSQEISKEIPNATPNAPRTYNYDSSTDLKAELNSINPQILDSDFE